MKKLIALCLTLCLSQTSNAGLSRNPVRQARRKTKYRVKPKKKQPQQKVGRVDGKKKKRGATTT